MNRETRRRLKQNEVLRKQSTFFSVDASKITEHQRMQEAMDEGITLGWMTAARMIRNVAKKIKGIGDKRAAEIELEYNKEFQRIRNEASKK